jgi:hypothetical protein
MVQSRINVTIPQHCQPCRITSDFSQPAVRAQGVGNHPIQCGVFRLGSRISSHGSTRGVEFPLYRIFRRKIHLSTASAQMKTDESSSSLKPRPVSSRRFSLVTVDERAVDLRRSKVVCLSAASLRAEGGVGTGLSLGWSGVDVFVGWYWVGVRARVGRSVRGCRATA